MRSASLVFPHQLYEHHPALDKSRVVYLIEDELFFSQYTFHKMKIAYHRATMRWYYNYLISQGYKVHYVEAITTASKIENLFSSFSNSGVNQLYISEVNDYLLHRRL